MMEEVELEEFPVVNRSQAVENQQNAGTETEQASQVSASCGAVVLENNNNQESSPRPKNFDDLLEKYVGVWGPFQLKLTLLLCLVLQQGNAPLRNNVLYILDVANHWCHVPGKPDNVTLETWKNLTLPWEMGPDGKMRHSQCEMYDIFTGNVTTCKKWDYDKTDYTLTVPSQNNWVCEHKQYPTNCFTARNIGGALGKLFFGIISDRLGRKPAFIFLLAVSISASAASFILSENYWWFLGLSFMRGLSGGSMFEMCSLIATEQSGPAHRSMINAGKWMSYVGGNITNVLLAMYLQDWHYFGWISLGMGFVGVFIWPFLPESARWLVSRGEAEKATKVLAKMAKVNGKDGDENVISEDVNYLVEENKKIQKISFKTVFLRRRLCLNFAMLTICISMSNFLFELTYLNAPRMSGYKFLNVIILFVAEFVGGTIGGFLMNMLGRRWTQSFAYLVSAAGGLFCAFAVPYMGYWELLGGAIFIKIGEAISSLAASTIRDEILPTPIRSTASGLAQFIAASISIIVPKVVALGNDNASFPYESICAVSIVGALAAMMLPETLHQRLPETIDEANNFSTKGKFWTFRATTASYNDEDRQEQVDHNGN